MNRGNGAGGCKTTYNGKQFENSTDAKEKLLFDGYEENVFAKKSRNKGYTYLEKKMIDKNIIFVTQCSFKKYIGMKYNIETFRYPDEAYIIEHSDGSKTLKILEKKEQNVNGSVETKLWSGPALKREYEIVFGDAFKIDYCFCVNDFLEIKMKSDELKYIILNQILKENKITVLFGDNENYYESLTTWLNSFL